MPLFLLGGINIYRSLVGTGVVRCLAYSVAEMGIKCAPMVLFVAWAGRPLPQQVFETTGGSEYDAPKAPVRRTMLTQ